MSTVRGATKIRLPRKTWMSRARPIHSNLATHMENKRPARPPISASNMLSVNNWRTSLPRPAPSATRMAISFVRLAPRASDMFAKLTQATTKTRPTTAINPAANARNQSSSVTPKYVALCSVSPMVWSFSTWSCSNRRIRTSVSACA